MNPRLLKEFAMRQAMQFDPNDPATLKQTLDEAADNDRLTLEEMQALPYVPFDDLLAKATATRHGDRIHANAQSHEIYRRTFEEARIRKGNAKLGSKDAENLFAGIFLKPDTVKETLGILREKAEEAKTLGYTKEEINVFTSLADMLEQAATA